MAKKKSMTEKDYPASSLPGSTVFRFCGNGLGIPGLPHEVTRAQAKELGMLEALQAALQNGNYEIDPVHGEIATPQDSGPQ